MKKKKLLKAIRELHDATDGLVALLKSTAAGPAEEPAPAAEAPPAPRLGLVLCPMCKGACRVRSLIGFLDMPCLTCGATGWIPVGPLSIKPAPPPRTPAEFSEFLRTLLAAPPRPPTPGPAVSTDYYLGLNVPGYTQRFDVVVNSKDGEVISVRTSGTKRLVPAAEVDQGCLDAIKKHIANLPFLAAALDPGAAPPAEEPGPNGEGEPGPEDAVSVSVGPEPKWQDYIDVSGPEPRLKGEYGGYDVKGIVARLCDGWSWADIMRQYPRVTEAEIRACLWYAMGNEAFPAKP